jgi:hypothetical protein
MLAALGLQVFLAHETAESYPQMEHYPTIRRSRAWLLGALIAILGLLAMVSALLRA